MEGVDHPPKSLLTPFPPITPPAPVVSCVSEKQILAGFPSRCMQVAEDFLLWVPVVSTPPTPPTFSPHFGAARLWEGSVVLRPRLLASGVSLLQLPLKFAVAAASSRFNPRPPVIGQLLRGKKSTPWQPDKPIKSPAGVTAASLQTGVGWAEEQRPLAQVHSLGWTAAASPHRLAAQMCTTQFIPGP